MTGMRARSLSEEQIHETLDQLEEAALAGRLERVQELIDCLWPARRRVSPLVAQRLASDRTRSPLVSFQILPIVAGAGTRQYLSRIARDASAPDLIRFSARRRMGWAERGEARARATFLASLEDPVATLVEALEQTGRRTPHPPSGETLEEVLRHLLAMPTEQACEVVTMSVRMLRSGVAWLLRGLVHTRDPRLRELALAGILEVRDAGAAAAMRRAARASRDPGFPPRVQDAIRQLETVSTGAEPAGRDARGPLPPIHSAYLSAIDGSGGQIAVVLRKRHEGLFLVSQIYFQDGYGLRDALGMSNIPWETIAGMYGTREGERLSALQGEDEPGIPLVEVDPAAVRGAVARAEEETLATGQAFPRAFEIWEPLIHEEDPPSPGEPVTMPELDDEGYRDRDDLYRHSGSLLEYPFFRSWLFDPADVARIYYESPADIPPFAENRLTLRHLRPLIGALLDEPSRVRLRSALRRQAWLLRQAGDGELSETTLAAAAGLAPDHPSEPARHPLLRGMAAFGVSAMMGAGYHVD